MLKARHSDFVAEVYELCHELVQDINQQLVYFRASVYKNETAGTIKNQITALASLVELLPGDLLREPFLDYEAELNNMLVTNPGECMFSSRVARLTQRLSAALTQVRGQRLPQGDDQLAHQRLAEKVSKHRNKIMSTCEPGSRLWNFFQSI